MKEIYFWQHAVTKLWHGPGLPRPLTDGEFAALEKFFPERFGPQVVWGKPTNDHENAKQKNNNDEKTN